ncbi:MAG: Gfo/Idh/MocA family protein [Saccharospirillum sp.]
MKSVQYGVIGCGMMGQEHLRNLALIDGAEVVAIFEPDAAMQEACREWVPEVHFCDSVETLCRFPGLGAIVVASPNHCHAEQLLSLMQLTRLPILIEKPLVTRLDQVEPIRQAVANHPAPVWVAMEYRYMPPVAQLRQHLMAGDAGPVKMLSIREHRFPFLPKVGDWNRFNANTGGTLVEKCCHFFDLMRLLLDGEAVSVMASAGQDVNHLDEQYGGNTPDILDNAYAIVNFSSGQRALLELCMFAEGSRYQEEISAVGPLAKVECLVPGPGRFWPSHLGEPPTPKVIVSPRAPKGPVESDIPVDPSLLAAGDHNGSTYYQHVGFFKAITEGAPVEVTVEDGLKAVVLGLAAQQSASTGLAVRITHQGYGFEVIA